MSHGKKKIIKQVILWVVILFSIVVLFFIFSRQTHVRIVRQNDNYIQDNAVQRVIQVEKVLDEAKEQIETLSYWLGTTLESSRVTPDQLCELEDNTSFNYVRYEGEIIGVLRGAFLAEERMKDLLEASFFWCGCICG